MCDGVIGYGISCLQCIVTVSYYECNFIFDTGNLCCFQLLDLDVLRVFFDILDSCLKSCSVFQSDHTVVLEKQKCSCFVCSIVRNCDRIAIFQIIKSFFFARIDSKWLIVDSACIYEVCSLLFVEVVKIRNMLEIVRIKISALYYKVWLYIIIKYRNFQIPSFFLEDWFCFFQNLCMRCCRSCYFDGSFLCISAYKNAISNSFSLIIAIIIVASVVPISSGST